VNSITWLPAARRSATARSKVAARASGVDPRPEQVVAAGRDADQVGRERHGDRHLLVDDLAEYLAADREVRIP
jgi:hypothetical protein